MSQGFNEKRQMTSANLGCKSQGWVTLNGSQDGSILRVNTEISCSFGQDFDLTWSDGLVSESWNFPPENGFQGW